MRKGIETKTRREVASESIMSSPEVFPGKAIPAINV
jgi:hypothetical protein